MKKNLILISFSFIISFIALIGITLTIKQRLKDLTTYSNAVVHTYMVINELQQVGSYVKDVETGTRGYLLSGDSIFLLPYLSSITKVDSSLDSLLFLIHDNISQINQYKLLKVDIKLKMGIMARYTMLKSKNQVKGVNDEMRKGNSLMTDIRNRIKKMTNAELVLLDERKKIKQRYEGITPTYLTVSLALSLIITIVCFFFILREFSMRSNYQKQLEATIEELNQSNNELQQIAEISSHDLQEPLRKLSLFSSKLLHNSKDYLDDNAKTSIERINASTQRMQQLIDDVVTYNNLGKTNLHIETVNLNSIITEVCSGYITTGALKFFAEKIPNINGDKKQLLLLFKHLVDNAVKYAKPKIPPFLKIKYELVTGDFLGKNN
ncbi:MAG: CHASE3 domain-containing protein, partial [Pedobacter sp.]|nr:CHASE3 domain-containing protein [Chitinophagaceae bacterium]